MVLEHFLSTIQILDLGLGLVLEFRLGMGLHIDQVFPSDFKVNGVGFGYYAFRKIQSYVSLSIIISSCFPTLSQSSWASLVVRLTESVIFGVLSDN